MYILAQLPTSIKETYLKLHKMRTRFSANINISSTNSFQGEIQD